MSATIEINKEDIARIKRDFKLMDNEIPVAVSRVVNRALSAVNTEASIQVRKVYALKAKRIKQNFSTKKATKKNLNATWRSRGEPVGLMQFSPRKNKKGVSVKVETGKPRKTIAHAFINISGQSGTKQVFRRQKINGVMVPRYEIYRLEGPRVEDALTKPGVQKALQKKADDTIIKRLDAEADYILSKAK